MNDDTIDWEYVGRVCKGDTESFRFFINKYKDILFTYASTILVDRQLAEEAVQDTFLNAFKYLKTFRRKSSFKTWLIRILINEANKKRKQSESNIILRENFLENEIHIDITIQENEYLEIVKHALKLIDKDKSLALRLFYLDGYSIKEIAELNNWSIAKTKVTLHRAKDEITTTVEKLQSKKRE